LRFDSRSSILAPFHDFLVRRHNPALWRAFIAPKVGDALFPGVHTPGWGMSRFHRYGEFVPPFQGWKGFLSSLTQGVALGYLVIALSGRPVLEFPSPS
jgi:hypothetical protein